MDTGIMDFTIPAFVTLFVVIDPPGMAPIFVAITEGEVESYRRRIAVRGVAVAGAILLAFAVAGEQVLMALGISIESFRIAGGLLLFLVAVDMLFARESPLRRTTPGETAEAQRRHDVSVFPLAIPLIAGPGSMTTVVLLMGSARGDLTLQGITLGVLAIVLLLLLATLLMATRINRLLGVTGSNVVSRVLGVILAALAVQYVLDGVILALGIE